MSWILILAILFIAEGQYCGVTGFNAWFGSWPNSYCIPGGAAPSWLNPSGRTIPTGIPFIDALLNGNPSLAIDSLRRLLLPGLALSVGLGTIILRRWEARREDRGGDRATLLLRKGSGFSERASWLTFRYRVALSHGLRESGLSLAFLVGAIPVVECTFGLHGLGGVFVDGLAPVPDLDVVLASLFVFTLFALVGRFALDGLRAYVDPRVRVDLQ